MIEGKNLNYYKPGMRLDFSRLIDSSGMEILPAVIVEDSRKIHLMVGFMNREAFAKTIELGEIVFWSRSRRELWYKGATSGNKLLVKTCIVDCDQDTLLFLVDPLGPVCHRVGKYSCFEAG